MFFRIMPTKFPTIIKDLTTNFALELFSIWMSIKSDLALISNVFWYGYQYFLLLLKHVETDLFLKF